jgi:hypothetical protein
VIETRSAAVAALLFLAAFGLTLGVYALTSSDGSGTSPAVLASPTRAAGPTPALTPTLAPLASPTPLPTPTPTQTADRRDCAAIAGTEYRSESERQWFLANCTGAVTSTPVSSASSPSPMRAATPSPSPSPRVP